MPEYFSRKMEPLKVGDLCFTKHEGDFCVCKVEVVEPDGTYKVSVEANCKNHKAFMVRLYGRLRWLK